MEGVGLSPEGHAQAGRIAATLAARPLAAILASPQRRAHETAFPIAARHGLPVTTEPGLDEIDFGAWSGAPFDTLDTDPRWHAWNRHRSLAACPGGETMLAAQARGLACLARCAAAWPGAEIVLVSHQDLLKAILAHLLGLSLDHLDRFDLDPASRTPITLEADTARVHALNLPP